MIEVENADQQLRARRAQVFAKLDTVNISSISIFWFNFY